MKVRIILQKRKRAMKAIIGLFAASACVVGISSYAPAAFAQSSGISLHCGGGICTVSDLPAGTAHWDWSASSSAAVSSPANCSDQNQCQFECPGATGHPSVLVTVTALGNSDQVFGTASVYGTCSTNSNPPE
jgi:hypothetical protein